MTYTVEQLQNLLGSDCYNMYDQLNDFILDHYMVQQSWTAGGKYGQTCLRYQRSGKTLCTIYLRENQLGIWIVFGKEERTKLAEKKRCLSGRVLQIVENTKVLHDGQWFMFDVENADLLEDIKQLLVIKKTPNRKWNPCGYCCDMCKAHVGNIKKKDEREILSKYWETYYDMHFSVEEMPCDGCKCKNADVHRLDDECPIRDCVPGKKISDCSECDKYPCENFMAREGVSYESANAICELDTASYYEYLWAYDNKSRLDRKRMKLKYLN